MAFCEAEQTLFASFWKTKSTTGEEDTIKLKLFCLLRNKTVSASFSGKHLGQ
jgi:hypothetical protein